MCRIPSLFLGCFYLQCFYLQCFYLSSKRHNNEQRDEGRCHRPFVGPPTRRQHRRRGSPPPPPPQPTPSPIITTSPPPAAAAGNSYCCCREQHIAANHPTALAAAAAAPAAAPPSAAAVVHCQQHLACSHSAPPLEVMLESLEPFGQANGSHLLSARVPYTLVAVNFIWLISYSILLIHFGDRHTYLHCFLNCI